MEYKTFTCDVERLQHYLNEYASEGYQLWGFEITEYTGIPEAVVVMTGYADEEIEDDEPQEETPPEGEQAIPMR